MSATFETRRYVAAKDVSKTVRARLKVAFPGVKFSVRTEHHTAVNVSWTDGPRSSAVDSLLGDLIHVGHPVMHESDMVMNEDGTVEIVSSGARYIFTRRDISDEWRDSILELFSRIIGRELSPSDMWNERVPLAVNRLDGRLYHMVETDTDYLADVYHRFTATREGGSLEVAAAMLEP